MRPARERTSVFGKRLTALRNSMGLNQKELAERLGVSRYHVNYLECRAKNPRMATVRRLAQFFGVSIDFLLADEDQQGPTETLEQKMEKVRNLPEEERRKVSEFIDQFTGDDK